MSTPDPTLWKPWEASQDKCKGRNAVNCGDGGNARSVEERGEGDGNSESLQVGVRGGGGVVPSSK